MARVAGPPAHGATSTGVGLMVGRFQPFHYGHANIVNRMIANHATVVVCVGSTGSSGTRHDPWTFDLRREMIGNVYHKRVKVVPLEDIGTDQGSDDWCDYVLAKVAAIELPDPTDYYTGSVADSRWYVNCFLPDGEVARQGAEERYTVGGRTRRLHVIPRDSLHYVPATDIRTYLETRSDGWRAWVPGVNHDLVAATYPERLKVRE